MLIEEYYDDKPGYHPYLITEQWQIAQLNYGEEQDPLEIKALECHPHTNETFTLLSGEAFLIAADEYGVNVEMLWMETGKSYNIPMKIWHNIAMKEGSSVLITENALTHEEQKNLFSLSKNIQKIIQEFGKQKEKARCSVSLNGG